MFGKKHGHTAKGRISPTYKSWDGIIQRCLNSASSNYSDYGGRGICVCDRWNPAAGGSFENFLYDMGERGFGFSIDRINVNGDYEPSNCRWATSKEQARNKRNTLMLELDGKTQSIMEWSEETGIPYSTIKKRINSYGWSHERALTTPNAVKPQKKISDVLVEFNGEKLCLAEWGRRYKLSAATIKNRLNSGWSPEKAITTPPRR